MTRIDALMERYAAAGSLAENGVEIVAVEDPAGARLTAALRRVMVAARDDLDLWDDIIQRAQAPAVAPGHPSTGGHGPG